MSGEGEAGEQVALRSTRIVRRSGGPLPFVPYGLIPAAGLAVLLMVALVPFAFGEIQSQTHLAVEKALRDAGATWVRWDTSGQWVTLTGAPPSREAGAKALAAAQAATSPTIFGDRRPATSVIEHFTWNETPIQQTPPNQLRITAPQAAPPASQPQAAAPQAAPPPSPAVAACDQSMAALLGSARIEFRTASSVIGSASGDLLDRIASAAEACSGKLRIEGHTDDVGRAAFNTDLSLWRAQAVRSALILRGINADRLVARGFGATKPVASNQTEDGRARNRRIEIHAVPD